MNILIYLALAAGIFFGGFSTAWKIQSANLEAKEREYVQAKLEASQRARINETSQRKRVDDAQAASAQRAQAARDDADAARSESERLRAQLDAATGGLPGPGDPTGTQRASAIAGLLKECSSRYEDLARKADGHVNDLRTLIDSWPR